MKCVIPWYSDIVRLHHYRDDVKIRVTAVIEKSSNAAETPVIRSTGNNSKSKSSHATKWQNKLIEDLLIELPTYLASTVKVSLFSSVSMIALSLMVSVAFFHACTLEALLLCHHDVVAPDAGPGSVPSPSPVPVPIRIWYSIIL